MPKKKPLDMESTLTQLDATVQTLESENTSLQDSIAAFEQGIGLIKEAQRTLDQASQLVIQLLEGEDDSPEVLLQDNPPQ